MKDAHKLTVRFTDTAVHAPITEAAVPEEKQQEEEDSMEGTHTVSASAADIAWLPDTAVLQ